MEPKTNKEAPCWTCEHFRDLTKIKMKDKDGLDWFIKNKYFCTYGGVSQALPTYFEVLKRINVSKCNQFKPK